jgi:2-aminoadipate transaminase
MIDYDAFLSRAASGMKESAIRRMGAVVARNGDVISFAPGYPSAETFPYQDFQEIARELLSGSDEQVLQYGPTRGFRPLVDLVAGIMAHRGAPTTTERLLITTGSQQGLDLVARVLLDPGDVVLVELPTYTGAIAAFRNVQAHMAGVRQEADGIDLAALDAVHARLVRAGRRVRLLYLVPNFQNPTGLLIGRGKRLALLEWAARHDILILEDDPYRDLYFDNAATEADVRPMKADDREGRVVYLSSFSKTLAAGYRVAWIDAPAPLAAKFEFAKQAADLCTGTLDQRLVYEVARRGILDRQLPLLRTHYREKRDVMVTALGRDLADVVSWADPRGGFFLWARLPEHLDANRLLDRAVRHGVVYVAGEAFFVEDAGDGLPGSSKDGGRNLLRLSFSAPNHSRIREGVVRLAAAIREELAELSPAASAVQQAR